MPELSETISVFSSGSAAYEEAFLAFLHHTDQKIQAKSKIAEVIDRLAPVPEASKNGKFVDVGAATGDVTSWFMSRFDETICVEPNTHFESSLQQHCPGAEILQKTILENDPARLAGANFILCSHVLYYIEPDKRLANLQAMSDWLRPGGILLVILQQSTTDCMYMLDHFLDMHFDLPAIADRFASGHAEAFEVAFEKVDSHVTTSTFDVAYQIAEFMLNLLPMTYPPKRSDLEAYIREHFQTDDGYRFSCSQDFLIVRRK
ncbi:Methyltransferase domain protein [Bremerella volcania]|uniref:Methyltransferase domain protein n=1 Tax=Bremerella volcania TaxID=2527984 RepID=A0A518C1L6_9BACT|nr:methyltransferase domain-containing protein [Bremerella volcania]QDU73116.1 Methyltransferase domain protein [Bremerella volcania]